MSTKPNKKSKFKAKDNTMDLRNARTYHAGIAQSKAHRSLSVLVFGLLKRHDITMLQWFMLGLVYDAGKKGIRITDIARQLDTTKAFVTKHIKLLEAKNLVSRSVGTKDTRSRIVTLTKGAHLKILKVETELRGGMRLSLYQSIEPGDLEIYIKVMNQLANLRQKQEPTTAKPHTHSAGDRIAKPVL